MTIYQWVFFDRGDDMKFAHFESTDEREADRAAWEYFSEYVENARARDELRYTTAETFDEFTGDDFGFKGAHYADCWNEGGLECTFFTITL